MTFVFAHEGNCRFFTWTPWLLDGEYISLTYNFNEGGYGSTQDDGDIVGWWKWSLICYISLQNILFIEMPWVHISLLMLHENIWFNYQMRYGHHMHKNIEQHTADTIVSWPNPKQWVIVHTSDLMMISQSIYILSNITREKGKLKTYSPPYCIMETGENMLNLTHTLAKIYLTGIL